MDLGRGGLAIDFNRCVELWEQSANQGHLYAQMSLAVMYKVGSKDGPPMTIPVDPQLGFRWCLTNPQATEILMNDLRDAMYYALAHNGTEASDEIQEALRLVTSFHCKDHVLQQGYDDDAKRNISQKDNIVPVNNILNKLSNIVMQYKEVKHQCLFLLD